ncbi:class I SAM-dependent methyltransferase [Algoriphagus sp.]|uniref:class I SAM-dependent methyltransferase n=1 Tax=Algoriphagus sp. TaxID=1872435 RepID=UPI0025EABE91|nr:class I SAM-dependent methyltransferase [Algoriphagus sp.]
MTSYIHGYVPEEQERLLEQAGLLGPLIYPRIDFDGCKNILEIGSGVGAQTQVLLSLFPEIEITCVDAEPRQIEKAKNNLQSYESRLSFHVQDARNLDLANKFDGAFLCWVLEHIPNSQLVLEKLNEHLEPGAKVWITEVFNSSFYFQPPLEGLSNYYDKYNNFHRSLKGDPDVGAKLGNMLSQAGFKEIELFKGGFHLSQHDSESLKKITTYWKGLMKSGAAAMLEVGWITKEEVDAMEKDIETIASDENAIFSYQFVQANARI